MEGFACARIILAVMGLHCVVSGDELDGPKDLEVLAVKSEVQMQWAPPNNKPQELFYEVHYRWYKDGEQWAPVPGCTHTEANHCVLSLDHFNCTLGYQTRVRSISGNRTSKWEYEHQFTIYDIMILQPPNFTVSVYDDVTLITLQTFSQMEKKYQKDCYKEELKLYLHLQKDGETHKMSYKFDDFNSRLQIPDLQRGVRYCATLELIPDNANLDIEESSELCFNTLESGTLEVAVTAVLSVACILLLIISLAIFLLKAFLKRPAQMPEALKSIATLSRSWQPLALDQFQVETVPSCLDKLKKQRESVDSGVSLEPHPSQPETLHLGSGCPLLMGLVQDSLSMSSNSGPHLLKETGSSCCSSSNTTVTEDSGVCMTSSPLLDFSGSESSRLSEVRLVVEISAPAEDCGYRSQMQSVPEDITYPTWETNSGGDLVPPPAEYRRTNKVCLCSKDSACFLCQMEGLMGRREAGNDRGWQEGSGCNVVIAQTDLTALQEPPQTLLQNLLTVYSDGYLKKGIPRPSLPPLLDMIHS